MAERPEPAPLRRAKIVATLGPATDDLEVLTQMMRANQRKFAWKHRQEIMLRDRVTVVIGPESYCVPRRLKSISKNVMARPLVICMSCGT